MRETTDVRLVITSATVTAADLAVRLNVKPDDSWKTGDVRGTFGTIAKNHGFVVESGQPLLGLTEQLRALIKRLAACAVTLGELSPHLKAQVTCRLTRRQVPPLDFDRDDLRWLAAMGAFLELDVILESHPPAAAKLAPGEKPTLEF